MGRHSPAVAELDRFEADRHRARALQLVAEWDTIPPTDLAALLEWGGAAWVVLKELARG